ncbi:NAD(P)H-dependent oxidoreductase [Nocardia sp. CA-290969]|uniref:NAD(P)H-dependent oxidoreductase n=1 Tax=Nocardia sp. CA-290969 TaxID=3239986 RepID=UPI003D904D51
MKTLIVYAHPGPKSLNGSLKDLAVSTLEAAGHEVQVSDLYAMNWKAVVDAADFGSDASSPLNVALDSGRAFVEPQGCPGPAEPVTRVLAGITAQPGPCPGIGVCRCLRGRQPVIGGTSQPDDFAREPFRHAHPISEHVRGASLGRRA